jgi:ABC-type antimicrobial peptide transport system permease subunit
VAETYNLKVGDPISVSFDRGIVEEQYTKSLTIVGFFGGKRPEATFFGPTVGVFPTWSYVSKGLFNELSSVVTNSSSAIILAKLNSGTNGTAVANQIRDFVPRNKGYVYSVSEQLEEQQTNYVYVGTLNVQRLGVAFAILATSVGVALVTLVSLRERQREASIMSVRGLSFKQLMIVLLTENVAVVTFAVLLGLVVGLIVVYWSAASFASTTISLVAKRMVFPTDALLTILAYFGLVFAATIVPVILMTRKYMSKLERVVRQA